MEESSILQCIQANNIYRWATSIAYKRFQVDIMRWGVYDYKDN